MPLTYMNSTAAIKAFCGERGGLVCTSSNAKAAFNWAFARGSAYFFCPTNIWDGTLRTPWEFRCRKPWCGTHTRSMAALHSGSFTGGESYFVERALLRPPAISAGACRQGTGNYPGIQVIVHPECRFEVCQKADAIGSTEGLIKIVEEAPEGSMFAVGTEIHLVNRLGKRFAPLGKKVITLDESGCLCTTMFRISPQHLAWALENLVEGRVVNRIRVMTM